MLPLALFALAAPALAHTGCGGHEIGRRNLGGRVIHDKRQVDNSNIDPAAECTFYSYPPVTAIASQFPAIWQPATLVSGDTEAADIFAKINASLNSAIPNDGPRCTNNGDCTGVNYDSSDPDCWWTRTGCTTPAATLNIAADITTVPEPNTWGFGFDDGPNCSHNALYNFLHENKQKATMFFIGSNVMDWPLQAIRAHDEGHQICVHTWSHLYMTSFSNEQAFAELYYTRKAIKEVIGVTPKCWRPPYGDTDNRIRMIAAALNMSTIVWSDDTDDWKVGTGGVTQQDVNNNYQKVIDAATAGQYNTHGPIVLNHEINNMTMQTMLEQYPKIKAAFKYIVPIATALNETHPYQEANITYPDFNTYISGQENEAVNNDPSATASSSGASGVGSSTAGAGKTSPAAGTESHAKNDAGRMAAPSVFAVVLGGIASLL